MFDRLDVKGRVVPGAASAILIIGGAGGRGPTPFALIDDPPSLDTAPFKRKSVSVHWEFMFTRSMFGAAEIAEQRRLLDEVSRLVDASTIRTTLAEHFGRIDAANLKRVHALIESGRARGKTHWRGFETLGVPAWLAR